MLRHLIFGVASYTLLLHPTTIKKKEEPIILSILLFSQNRCWQRAIFPGGGPPSIFASAGLYDRVRDGNGWFTSDWSPTNLLFAVTDYFRLQLYAEDCTRYNIINLTFPFELKAPVESKIPTSPS